MDAQTLAQATAVASVAARAAGDVLLLACTTRSSTTASQMLFEAEAAARSLLNNCELGFEIFGLDSASASDSDSGSGGKLLNVDGLELPLAPVWIVDVPKAPTTATAGGSEERRYLRSELVVSVALAIKGVPAIGVVYVIATLSPPLTARTMEGCERLCEYHIVLA